MAKQPKNETFLAAELAACGVPPGKAAFAAQELCRLGRRYFRLSESLCSYPDDEGKREKARTRVALKVDNVANSLMAEFMRVPGGRIWLVADGGGLGLVCITNNGSYENRTALR